MIATAAIPKSITTYIPPGKGTTELLMGPPVLKLLEDAAFIQEWKNLYNACPWATVFQSPSFVATWYQVYRSYLPILIKTETDGKLTGLLTLAKDKKGLITGAGANQAEYQVWLTADEKDETFIKASLTKLYRFFPRNRIQLKYIPASVPLSFTKNDTPWNKRCFLKSSPQPVMVISEDHFNSELKKKNRREKINRLKRLGNLKFERINDYNEFYEIFDELALQSDFRKGAMYNKVAFKTDACRKEFLLSLFEQNILHVTVLKIDDRIIAANVSIGTKQQLHLSGINSFAAALARHSPGIIHFLMLGKLLAEEGADVFDLTPGADSYKEILATDHTVAYTLSIGNKNHKMFNRLQTGLNSWFKKTTALAGIKPEALKKAKKNYTLFKNKFIHVARQGILQSSAFLIDKLKPGNKTAKCWAVQRDNTNAGVFSLQYDDLKDLLNFDDREIRYSQQEFLSDAMRRFEEGAHCYTWTDNGLLLGCAWIGNMQSSINGYNYGNETEDFIMSLSGIYCHRKGRKGFPYFLRSVANALALDAVQNKLFIVTDYNDDRSFELAGFQRLK
ncbi:GNAT family N-acetyltransferase [Niastella sp. OAS944]|uniref:GNAT family N-acetyltransferase n=1 Tax=Niastella sp. OAS944 TaxID=2664089 RepID=UPI00349B8B48|nr:CelD/BcsL family acetyltransferase involved in cellulose biosynthesis [Chitinophagaceae bacterium OAS944]